MNLAIPKMSFEQFASQYLRLLTGQDYVEVTGTVHEHMGTRVATPDDSRRAMIEHIGPNELSLVKPSIVDYPDGFSRMAYVTRSTGGGTYLVAPDFRLLVALLDDPSSYNEVVDMARSQGLTRIEAFGTLVINRAMASVANKDGGKFVSSVGLNLVKTKVEVRMLGDFRHQTDGVLAIHSNIRRYDDSGDIRHHRRWIETR